MFSFFGGGEEAPTKVSFHYVAARLGREGTHLLHTMSADEQSVLIRGTVRAEEEEDAIAAMERRGEEGATFVVYGRNAQDEKPEYTARALRRRGLDACVYPGGLFEWLILQELLGEEKMPTDGHTSDVFRYNPATTCGRRQDR